MSRLDVLLTLFLVRFVCFVGVSQNLWTAAASIELLQKIKNVGMCVTAVGLTWRYGITTRRARRDVAR